MTTRSLILLVTLALGCTEAPSPIPPGATIVTFGAAISRTGSSAVDTWGNAFQLAADDVNQGLAEAGYPTGPFWFRTVISDSMNRADVAVEKTQRMLGTDQIKMVLTGTSADALALLALNHNPDLSPMNIPVVCVACSSPSHHNPNETNANPALQAAYRNIGNWHFGLSMSSLPQSRVLARIIEGMENGGDVNRDGKLKVATVHIDDTFGRGFAGALRDTILTARPDAIVEQLSHPARNDLLNDFALWSETVRRMCDDRTGEALDVEPDVILEITFPQFSLALFKAYAASRCTVPFLHTHSMREKTVLLQIGRGLEGHEGTSYLPLDGESGRRFEERFLKTVGLSRQSQWDGHVYDGYVLTALATLIAAREHGRGELTGERIRDAFAQVNVKDGEVIRPGPDEIARAAAHIARGEPINYEGASGSCDFDGNGRALNRISHWRVNKQVASDVAVYDCPKDPMVCPRVE